MRSRQRLDGWPEPAGDQAAAEHVDHRLIDQDHGHASVALDDVDDLEAGDVDTELGGEREHLGGGAGAVGNGDPDLGHVLGVDHAGGQVRAGLTGRVQPIEQGLAVVGVDDAADVGSGPSISSSSASRMAGRFSAQMSSQIAGLPARDPGHVAEATGGEAQQCGVLLGTVAGETHQGRRGEVRHVADDGDQVVVTFGVDRHDLGAERSDDARDGGERGVVGVAHRA